MHRTTAYSQLFKEAYARFPLGYPSQEQNHLRGTQVLFLEERAGIEVVDTLTLQAAVNGESACLGLSEDAAFGGAALWTVQAIGVKVFEQPPFAVLII